MGGMGGSNWSFSHINRTTNPPTVTTKFIHVVGYPNITVTMEDDGTTPQGGVVGRPIRRERF